MYLLSQFATLTRQVDRWFRDKYMPMYVARYDLGGNKNEIVTKAKFKAERASYNERVFC